MSIPDVATKLEILAIFVVSMAAICAWGDL